MAPSFFKILEDPFNPHFILPPEFVRKHMDDSIPEDLVTLTANGGRSWVLKIELVNKSYCFTKGWKQVANDIRLGYSEYLVFHLVDQSAFNLTIYKNGCELLLPPKKEPYEEEEDDDEDFVNEFENAIVIENDESEEVIENDEVKIKPYEEDKDLVSEFENVIVINDDDSEDEKENNEVDGDNDKENNEANNLLVVKRKRGRPRKQTQPETINEISVTKTEVVKRKRGRPRKQHRPSGKIPATEVVERKRGLAAHLRGSGKTI